MAGPESRVELQVPANAPLEGGTDDGMDEYGEGLFGDAYLLSPWKMPSAKLAQSYKGYNTYQGGQSSFWSTGVRDFKDLGVGIYLYFKIQLVIAVLFILMTICLTPILYLNSQGNDGHALEAASRTPFAALTLGNQGFNADTIKSPTECMAQNGTVDCTGETVRVAGQPVAAPRVSYAISGNVFFGSIILLVVFHRIRQMIQADIEKIDGQTLSPKDYSVFVRGLPGDASVSQIREHFSSRYDLSKGQLSYPVLGLSVNGVALLLALSTFTFALIVVASSLSDIPSQRRAVVSLGASAGAALFVACIALLRGVGKPSARCTPMAQWEQDRAVWIHRMAHRKAAIKLSQVASDPADPCSHDTYPVPPPAPSPVVDVSHLGCNDFLGSWVADVNCVHACGETLSRYMAQQSLLRSLSVARAEVKKWTFGAPPHVIPSRAKKAAAEKRLKLLEKKLKDLEEGIKKSNLLKAFDVIEGAFVTFNNEESARRCMDDYRASNINLLRRFQPKQLQFQHIDGKYYALRIVRAPEPSDIIWENLECSDGTRILRKSITAFITFILLVVSFIIIYLAQSQQAEVARTAPDLKKCATDIPAAYFGHYLFKDSNLTLLHVPAQDRSCKNGSFYFTYSDLDYTNLSPIRTPNGRAYPRTRFNASRSHGRGDLCDSPCSGAPLPDEDSSCASLACFPEMMGWSDGGFGCQTYKQSDLLGCYCYQRLTRALQSLGVWAGIRHISNTEFSVCGGYVLTYARSQALGLLAAVVVVFINTLLKTVLKRLSNFERHFSVSNIAASTTFKIFISQLINTAIISILVNAKYREDPIPLFRYFFRGRFTDTDRGWYAAVGVSLSTTMAINVVVPHVGLIMQLFLSPITRFLGARSAVTQEQYNALYEGAEFDLESRYAMLLNTLFVTLLFSTGLPILVAFAAGNFILTYVIDKALLLGYYRKPPVFDASLASMVASFLPLCLALHLSMSTWLLTTPELLPSGTLSSSSYSEYVGYAEKGGVQARITRMTAFPLFVFFVLYVSFWIAYAVVGEALVSFLELVRSRLVALFLKLSWATSTDAGGDGHDKPHRAAVYSSIFECAMTADQLTDYNMSHKLAKEDFVQGWRVREDGEILYKVWTESGSRDGIEHKEGQEKKTWEVMRDAALHSYNIILNHRYRHAIMAIRVLAPVSPKYSVTPTRKTPRESARKEVSIRAMPHTLFGNEAPDAEKEEALIATVTTSALPAAPGQAEALRLTQCAASSGENSDPVPLPFTISSPVVRGLEIGGTHDSTEAPIANGTSVAQAEAMPVSSIVAASDVSFQPASDGPSTNVSLHEEGRAKLNSNGPSASV